MATMTMEMASYSFSKKVSPRASRLVNYHVEWFAADGKIRASAERDEQIHLGADVHVVAVLGADLGMFHFAGDAVDLHVLIQIKRARNVFRKDAVGSHSL